MLEQRGDVEAPPVSQGVREVATNGVQLHPPPQTSVAACREVSPEPLVLPAKKKKQKRNRVATSCSYIVGHLTGGLIPWGLQRNL